MLVSLLRDDSALYEVRWSAPVQQAAGRLDQAKAGREEMRLGLRSRREVIESDYGRDPDDVDADIALDKSKRDDLGIVSDGDPSQVTTSGSAQQSS